VRKNSPHPTGPAPARSLRGEGEEPRVRPVHGKRRRTTGEGTARCGFFVGPSHQPADEKRVQGRLVVPNLGVEPVPLQAQLRLREFKPLIRANLDRRAEREQGLDDQEERQQRGPNGEGVEPLGPGARGAAWGGGPAFAGERRSLQAGTLQWSPRRPS